MKSHFADGQIDYDGTQIHSLWAYRTFGVQGDSIIAFLGACDIPFDHMVDLEDVRARSRIASPSMLHFIVEHFDRFLGPGKLSISIATLTPVSAKIHFGINIERAHDVGVETRALADLGSDPTALGRQVQASYMAEMDGVLDARTRVRGTP